jgi:hypothetical protein
MNIHMPSVVKSGGIAVLISIVLGLLAALPLVGCLVWPLVCLGWILIPLGAGLGYGYLAPGKEALGESALGGALAGGFSGFIYGLVSGIVGLITNAGTVALMEDPGMLPGAFAGGVAGLLISICLPLIGGSLFGALGGVIWPAVQGNRT